MRQVNGNVLSEIPVVFTPDENYIVPTSIAILSMLRTKKIETRYKFYIVISEKFDSNKLTYLNQISSMEKDFNHQIIRINSEMFDNQKITTEHISSSAYYRLILANILSDCDKCMYHDGDILVNADLSEMYNIDMDECYVGGVKAIGRQQDTESNKKRMKAGGFSSYDNYIFSGDLVFNLELIRKDNLTKFFIEKMNEGFLSEDQDVINYCCYNRIYILPLKYCMLNQWLNNNLLVNMKRQVYGENDLNEAKNNPSVVHFAGAIAKPWVNLRVAYSEKWWQYAKEILSEKEYSEWYDRAKGFTKRWDWSYLEKQLDIEKNVILFAYSEISKNVFDRLNSLGYHVSCFIDNDIYKQGKEYKGCMVFSPDAELVNYKNSIVVNTNQLHYKEIRNQLVSIGVEQQQIIDYYHRDSRYFSVLDPKYYGEELRYMCSNEWSINSDNMTMFELIDKLSDYQKQCIGERFFLSFDEIVNVIEKLA